jgi:hypothetical protein
VNVKLQSNAAYVERMTFSQKLIISINRGLENGIGAEAADSIGFFIDPRIAVKDPKKYWSNLDKMFNHQSDGLKSKLISSIAEQFGMQNSQFPDFASSVEAAKAKFLKDDLVDPSN